MRQIWLLRPDFPISVVRRLLALTKLRAYLRASFEAGAISAKVAEAAAKLSKAGQKVLLQTLREKKRLGPGDVTKARLASGPRVTQVVAPAPLKKDEAPGANALPPAPVQLELSTADLRELAGLVRRKPELQQKLIRAAEAMTER